MKRRSGLFFLVIVLCFLPAFIFAQCENTTRTYANFQGAYLEGLGLLGAPTLVGTISDASNAVNGQVKDASTLNVGIGLVGLASATQFLEFTTDGTNSTPRLIPAGKPVTIKISLPTEVLSILSGVEIGTFTNLSPVTDNWPWLIGAGHAAGYNAASKVAIYNSTNIAGVISGAGETEITITPTQAYHGIYVKVSGSLLSVALSAKLFHAYILEETTATYNCDEVIDVLSGVQPTVIGGVLNATGTVENPFNAIDGNDDSFALMNVGASVLNKIYLTAIFNKPAQPADSVSIILQKPGGGLLDLNLLTGFTIQPYLNGSPAGPAFNNAGTFLNLRLFPGSADKYQLTFPITTPYDRLEITTGGLAGVLGSLKIYEIRRKLAKPRTLTDPAAEDQRTICQGETTSFTVNNPQDCTTYNWTDTPTGGSPLHTGLTYTPPANLPAGDYTYYVQSSRTYCVNATSEALKVRLKINPLPTVDVTNETICSGSAVTLSVNNPDGAYTYNWYSSISPSTHLASGNSFTTPVLTASTSYYVEAVNTATGCKSAGGPKAVNVQVKPVAVVNAISGANEICVGASTMLVNTTAGGVWSSADPAIATISLTGKVTGIADGNVVISYTVPDDAVSCGKQVDFNFKVNGLPELTLLPVPAVCEGVTATVLPYTNPVFNPITYSITWQTAGFVNVSDSPLPLDEIPLVIPVDASPEVHNGILTLKNAYCSKTFSFSVKVKLVPPKPIVSIQ
ncbi:Ig-like domain-containing protein [Pedobacter rhizosphaerae]|uniref:Ig-like domain (Group 2) n=1 Tax=Pedobacter rhizosphaerae TaxID=390241 RepID=A0A1H9VBF6_9SPHI|nr:Ig-like domain-containing protein [Pedobacter rhizosphaerae]SES18908.1 Ig-like domain (group 2) [Pedobacter rhizosphaerae]